MAYATIEDIELLFRPLSNSEKIRADNLIDSVEDILRQEAFNRGKDLDLMISNGLIIQNVLKQIIVDIVARTLMTSTNSEPMTQFSQSALGYSVSGSFLNAGGGIFVKRDELKRLGIIKQRLGSIEL